MVLDEQRINAIVQRVVSNLRQEAPVVGDAPPAPAPLAPLPLVPAKPSRNGHVPPATGDYGVFPDVDAAVAAAQVAQKRLIAMSMEKRQEIIGAMRTVAIENAEVLARMAAEETGMGRWEDKLQKNLLVARKTPGPEVLRPEAWSGDKGLTLVEWAPYGVIGGISPSTNPTSTVICNTIGMLAAGNSVVYNAHPGAKDVTVKTIQMLNRAIVGVGGPPNLIATIPSPTIESAQYIMKHPGIRLLAVTGGPGVVRVAMESGKKAICAGPGNPPVVVDETADIDQAARDIITGASFDNNLVCVLEKEIIAVDVIADQLKAAMVANGVRELTSWEMKRLEKVIFKEIRPGPEESVINKAFVGKNPAVILREVGIGVADSVRLALVEVDRSHPLVWTEQLMPVIPLVRVRNADEAIDLAIEAEGGRGHTAVMHSKHLDHLSRMAREINTSIFIKNGPSLAGLGFGGEGFTSFSIASPTGEGITNPISFSRLRRCTLVDSFRIV